jgi:hypothetical protein
MKQIKRLGMVAFKITIACGILGLGNAHATSALNLTCPEKFIATVTNVEEVEVTTAFPKVEVDFQIIQTLKGNEVSTKKIRVVKDGPVKFKSGEIYTVEANSSWLCSATVFSKL